MAYQHSWEGTPIGTQLVYVEWIVKNGATASEGVTLQTTTTGTGLADTIIWDNTLDANAWLKINSSGKSWDNYVSTDSGATWALSNGNVTGEPPRMQGGVENTIAVICDSTGEVELGIKYIPRYT